jgi:hypothetical protein
MSSSPNQGVKDVKFFADRLRKDVPDCTQEPHSEMLLVAMVLDMIVYQKRLESNGARRHYAVVKSQPGSSPIVLYVINAPTRELAFCIMCLDACKDDEEDSEDIDLEDVRLKDPEYKTLDIVAILKDVGDRAGWDVTRLWSALVSFCECGDIEPYSIVPATERLCSFADLE